MKINFDKLAKGVLIFSLLLVAISFFYYYVIFLPQKEESRLEQQRQEQLAKEYKEQEAKEDIQKNKELLDNCLTGAVNTYSRQWDRECEAQGLLTEECKELLNMSFEDYQKKYNLSGLLEGYSDYVIKKNECSCRLPTHKADDLESYRKELKDECFKKYPQK